MANYRRFYMRKMLFQYPWVRDSFRRRYLIGCIKAFLKSAMERRFYQLGQQNYWGPLFKKFIKFDYDKNRSKIVEPDHNAWKKAPAAKRPAVSAIGVAPQACGGGGVQLDEFSGTRQATQCKPGGCGGGGSQQLPENEVFVSMPSVPKAKAQAVHEA
jgi:anaerobic magnesium-protoporphyrin IX monomethyl ester cyclase